MNRLEKTDQVIGSGSGGVVRRAKLTTRDGCERLCAVKYPQSTSLRFPGIVRGHLTEVEVYSRIARLRDETRRFFPAVFEIVDLDPKEFYGGGPIPDIVPNPFPVVARQEIDGEALYDWVERRHDDQSLRRIETARSYARSLSAALEALHGEGVAVVDIYPTDIIVDAADAIPKWFDFNAAIFISPGVENTVLPQARPYFMPPESFLDASPSLSGDIFALGVMIYYLMTSKILFTLDSNSHNGKTRGDSWEKRYAQDLIDLIDEIHTTVRAELHKYPPPDVINLPSSSEYWHLLWLAESEGEKKALIRKIVEEIFQRSYLSLSEDDREAVIENVLQVASRHPSFKLEGKVLLEDQISSRLAKLEDDSLRDLLGEMCHLDKNKRPDATQVRERLEEMI